MGALITVLNKSGENAAGTALKMLRALQPRNAEAYGLATPSETQIEKTVEALENHKLESDTILGHAFSRILETDKPQPLKLISATLVFEGRLYPARDENSFDTIAEKLGTRLKGTAANLIKNTEGDFAFAIAEPQQIVAGRDPTGARPLYYGESASFVALASERKALWKIGITKTESFPPGHTALLNKHGFTFEPVKTLKRPRPAKTTLAHAAERIQTLLQKSVANRVENAKDVAIAFSGGLDSSLIAALAKNAGANVHLIHVSLKRQEETRHAQKVAEEMNLPIHAYLYDEQDVKNVLPKVLRAIEETDPVKVAIGVPFFWAAQETAKMGLRVVLAGQGADELFGGYKRYADTYLAFGKETAEKNIFNDVATNYKSNLERDSKICSFHGTELRLPFTSYQLTEYALRIPLELNIERGVDSLRKLVLRKTAENLDLPSSVVYRPKKAIQYATGVSKVLRKLARESRLNLKEYLMQCFRATTVETGEVGR